MNNEQWTVETLKEYTEKMFDDMNTRFDERSEMQKSALEAALAAVKEATQKAEAASDVRFSGVNEFRNTLADQQRTLMPRTETELLITNISTRLKSLEDTRLERGSEKTGVNNFVLTIVGIIGFALVVLQIYQVIKGI